MQTTTSDALACLARARKPSNEYHPDIYLDIVTETEQMVVIHEYSAKKDKERTDLWSELNDVKRLYISSFH